MSGTWYIYSQKIILFSSKVNRLQSKSRKETSQLINLPKNMTEIAITFFMIHVYTTVFSTNID